MLGCSDLVVVKNKAVRWVRASLIRLSRLVSGVGKLGPDLHGYFGLFTGKKPF